MSDIPVTGWLVNIVLAALIFFVGRWAVGLAVKLADSLMMRSEVEEILRDFVTGILKWLLLLLVVVAALAQLGINTTSLVVLIGAAGLAVGLALKDSLANFAAGVMLVVFRPFRGGDFIDAAGVMGVVEKIQIFATTMRTLDNKEVIVPNGAIYAGTITNFSARDTRRIDLIFSIGYGDDIKKAKAIIEEIMDKDERILGDPEPTVGVMELATNSVDLFARPWVNSEDWWSTRIDLLEKVKEAFDENGISIPFPQMDLHVQKEEL